MEHASRGRALVVCDGHPGLIAVVKKRWAQVPRQRCILHRMRNIRERIPATEGKRVRMALTRGLYAYASSERQGVAGSEAFLLAHSETYRSACEVLVKDLTDCLTFFRFPPRYWKRLRTSNSIEQQFREVRKRTRVIGRCPWSGEC